MVGEQFDHGDEICGAVVSVRAKQEKIALWTRDASDEAAQVTLLRASSSSGHLSVRIFSARHMDITRVSPAFADEHWEAVEGVSQLQPDGRVHISREF